MRDKKFVQGDCALHPSLFFANHLIPRSKSLRQGAVDAVKEIPLSVSEAFAAATLSSTLLMRGSRDANFSSTANAALSCSTTYLMCVTPA